MTPHELTALLAEHGIRPLKARGQHFLLDEGIVRSMVAAAGVTAGDNVVEIGSGPGILTESLLASGASVVAVEIDVRLASLLASRFPGADLRIVRTDARKVPNRELAAAFGGGGKYKVVANLPYNVTSDILVKFTREEPRPVSVTVMVQREVADRLCARPPHMSAIAVTVRAYAAVSKVCNVPAGAFLPPPRVDSAVIHIDLSAPGVGGGTDIDAVLRIAHAAFGAKRRQIRNSLTKMFPSATLERAFVDAKIDPSVRPQELDVSDWARLAAALTA